MNIRKAVARLAAIVAAVAVLSVPAFATSGTVSTVGATLNLRSAATTNSSVMAQLPSGTWLNILGVTDSNWYKVQVNGLTGYVSGQYVTLAAGETAQKIDEPAAAAAQPTYVKVTCGVLNIRQGAGTGYAVVGSLTYGQVVQVTETLDGWYHISNGYISADYAQKCDASAATATAAATPAVASNVPASAKGAEIAALAQQFVGYPYVTGGSSPAGFDCSGFTSYLYRQYGVTIGRTPASQLYVGVAVSRDALQPGDILVFNAGSASGATHCALYIGNGYFVHAANHRAGVRIDPLSMAYYSNSLVACRRIFT